MLIAEQEVRYQCKCTSGGSGWGDPHYTTFDDKKYDFVHQGEYILFGVNAGNNREFLIEVRLLYLPWRASTTKALAFGEPGIYGYQV